MSTASTQLSRIDPTRTLSLRNSFARDMNRRFNDIIADIRTAVVKEDVFGLTPTTFARGNTPGRKAFVYPSLSERIAAFMEWIDRLVENNVLENRVGARFGTATEAAWTRFYVRLGYEQGIRRARQELIKARYQVPLIDASGGIPAIMRQPTHNERLGILIRRTNMELKGVTDAMKQQINRVLSQAMMQGKNAKQIASLLVKTIGGPTLELTDSLGRFIPAKRRAQMIARTELIRTFAGAVVQEYRLWGILGARVKAEILTAGDDRVCARCHEFEGKIFTLDEIDGLIPAHVQCRCLILPVSQR